MGSQSFAKDAQEQCMVITPTMGILPLTVIDANVLIALCARELDKYAVALAAVEKRVEGEALFYAPGVIASEALFVFCRKLSEGTLSPAAHAKVVQSFGIRMKMALPPPSGEAALVLRAEQIRGSYGCSRSADGLYLALLEELAQSGAAELLTFDVALKTQASLILPDLTVILLRPSPSSAASSATE